MVADFDRVDIARLYLTQLCFDGVRTFLDFVARNLQPKMQEVLGQPVLIDNRGGNAGMIGLEYASKQPGDGYTIVLGNTGTIAINQSVYPKMNYDAVKDFVPIGITTTNALLATIAGNVPANNLKEFVAYAKANPGKLNYGTPGLGSSSHLTGEMLKLAADIQMTHVPYAGLAPALTDLLAGHTDVMTANLDSVLALVQEGKLKGLAVTSEKRAPELPDLPAIAESYPEVVSTSWFAVVAPPKTPPEIADKLSRAFAEILREPEVEKKWREMALTPVGGTPDEVGAFLKAETARWRNVIVSGGIKRQ
jgi:tripartite-type tricarboxylate transporter receptor subunit TctC